MSITEIITITDKAKFQIQQIMTGQEEAEKAGVRVCVIGGGCSGLSYKIDMSEQKEKDNIIMVGAVKIFVDPKSAIYLKGVVLDFQDGLNGKGFVFDNPNAKNTCGCGESFSI